MASTSDTGSDALDDIGLPVFLLASAASAARGDELVLDGPEGHHAAAVRRLTPGRRLVLTDGRGTRLVGTVTEVVGKSSLRVVVEQREDVPAREPRLVVVQALVKGDRSELAVDLLTELGVDEIVPWAAARCVVQWRGDKVAKGVDKWRSVALEAAKQSRRPWHPVVADLSSTNDVARRLAAVPAALVLHEQATTPLASVALPAEGDVVLVVGPEGGVSDEELAVFEESGARPVRLGPEVLRASTAGAAALAAISSTLRWSGV